MKKVLFLFITFICSLTIVYAQDEYVQKWMNDNISIDVAKHMIQVDDGLIVGGSNSNAKAQLAKYDHNGKEIKTLKLDYEGTINGFFEKDGKYYFIATNYEKDWEVYIYEITSDLTIVRSNNTGFHFEGLYEQADLNGNKLYITSVDSYSFAGVYDEDDQYYAYFYINLSDFSVGTGDNEKVYEYFGSEKSELLKLVTGRVPARVVREKDDLIIVVGSCSEVDLCDGYGFVQFYDKTDNLYDAFMNESYKAKGENFFAYTSIELLDEYVVAAGDGFSLVEFYNYEGEKVDSVDFVESLYDSNHDLKFIQIEDMIYQKGRFSVAYQVCDNAYEQAVGCKTGIVVYQKKFNIESKTDGFGTVIVKSDEYGSEEVTFKIEPLEGYQLKEVKVTDKDGNVIVVTDNKSFTMPFSDVIVEVVFEPKNPETLTGAAILGVGLLLILSLIAIVVNVRKAKDLM